MPAVVIAISEPRSGPSSKAPDWGSPLSLNGKSDPVFGTKAVKSWQDWSGRV